MISDRAAGAARTLLSTNEGFKPGNHSPEQQFAASMSDLARTHHFLFYLVGTFPSADRPALADNAIASNWPDDIYVAYEAAGVFHASRLITLLRDTSLPVVTNSSAFDLQLRNKQAATQWQMFDESGFATTVAFSAHTPDGQRHLFVMSGKREPTANMASLYYDGSRYLETYSRAKAEGKTPGKVLSAREAECLTWSAGGKSSEEIAVILGISPHTVNFYLQTAMRKLECSNRMQAVARALRLRLI